MKRLDIILLTVTIGLCMAGCRDKDQDKGYFIESSLKVMDGITSAVRGGENVKLTFYDNDGTVSSSVRRTDKDGAVVFKGSSNGKYLAEFSYFGSSSYDNQMEFTIEDSGGKSNVVMTVEPPEEKPFLSPVIITGLMVDPAGWDQAVTGANVTWDPSTIIYQHDGSYEYVQFMALEDIDFSVTPYSVVFANSGPNKNNVMRSVNAAGWAQGGNVTYKLDLTEGKADKGEFFYVGGDAMRIAGFVKTCSYFSEKIDGANWIRVKNYPSEAGDGFGNKTIYDLMDNADSPKAGENVADGVGIFRGTDVTAASVPVDAIFFGAKIDAAAYDPVSGFGYRVPENEFYSASNASTGEAQPFFGQGTNTFMLRDSAVDYNTSEFIMLGGVFDTGKVYSPRGATYKVLSACPGSASLADIESGTGISYILAPQ